MSILSLQLTNFRGYVAKTFEFDEAGSTLVVGDNAVGKTNLIEALWMLARGKSFRAGHDREMIAYGEEIARVEGFLASQGVPLQGEGTPSQDELEVVVTAGLVAGQKMPHKRYLVNGVSKRRMDFVGKLPAVLFRPEDMELIAGSPHVRREYLDSVLEQVDAEYRRSLLSYKKGLRQRNKLLERIRDGEAQHSQLLFWDQLLIKNGDVIAQKRQELIGFVNEAFGRDKISQVFGGLEMVYDRSVVSEGRLQQYAREEVAAGITLVGPHRDNFLVIANKRDLSVYGSRGEQRLAILALKLAELSFVTGKIGQRPLLLLDDIFSELDHEHREDVLQVVGQQQTILTTTDLHLVEPKYRRKMELRNLATNN